MNKAANKIQKTAKPTSASTRVEPDARFSQTGFVFDAPGPFVLKSCADYRRWQAAGTSRCRAAHLAHHWVLDYLLEIAPGFSIACGTEATGPVARPERVAHLYPPGSVYLEASGSGGWMRSAWMIFSADVLFLRTLVAGPAGFARIHDPSGDLGEKLVAMAAAAEEGNRRYCDCAARALETLSLLQGAQPVGTSGFDYRVGGDRARETFSQRVLHHLERHYPRPLTVPGIARALGVSTSTLAHRFREETGETVIQALQRVRLEQSLPYLSRGARIKEVAAAVGFASPFYYSKVFRDHQGLPPGAWRDQSHTNSERTAKRATPSQARAAPF